MKIYPLLFSYITILLLVACFSTNNVTSIRDVTSTIIPTETSYPIPILTVTPTYIVTSTPLPIPTLSEKTRQELVLELLKTNNGCKLPCFWGVVPGTNTLVEGKQILANLGLMLSDPEVYGEKRISSLGLVELYGKIAILSNFGLDQGDHIATVELKVIGTDYAGSHYSELQSSMAEYSPQSILNSYGEPSRVWVVTSARYRYGASTGFDLWVFYDQQGFLITYSEPMEFATTYHYCPRFGGNSHIDNMSVILSYPNNPNALENQDDRYDLLKKSYPDYIYPIEKLGYTISEFYEIVEHKKQDGCLIIKEETLRK